MFEGNLIVIQFLLFVEVHCNRYHFNIDAFIQKLVSCVSASVGLVLSPFKKSQLHSAYSANTSEGQQR